MLVSNYSSPSRITDGVVFANSTSMHSEAFGDNIGRISRRRYHVLWRSSRHLQFFSDPCTNYMMVSGMYIIPLNAEEEEVRYTLGVVRGEQNKNSELQCPQVIFHFLCIANLNMLMLADSEELPCYEWYQ